MTLTRLPDWDRRLARVVEKHLHLPGEWGVTDCGMTVGDAVEAVTGTNPLARFAGRYKTEAGAARLMRKQGWHDMTDVLASMGAPDGRLKAQRGDVATVMQGGQVTAGFVCDRGVAAKSEHGLAFYPVTDIIAAFKIGRV